MSNDLIARLRYMTFETWDDQPNECEAIVRRAADEIERLRARAGEAEKAHEVTMRMLSYEAESAEARADALAGALKELVKINEDHNKAIERIIGSPPGWNDSYLDRARAALAEQEKGQ